MRAILKISLTVLTIFALTQTEVRGQGGWNIQNSGTTNNLNHVYYLNQYTGFTVGSSGTILKTTNGGKNWSAKQSGTTKNLRSINFITFAKGYCTGDSGTFLYTLDTGMTWEDMSFTLSNNLNSVLFTDAYNGFIAGDSLILSTFDGGQNWEYNYLLNSLLAICFPGAANGYAIDHQGGIYRSEDGGHDWRRFQLPFNIMPTAIYFTGVSTGYITGASPYNMIKTSDGGTNWIVTHSGASSLNTVYFTQGRGFTGGDNGVILKTTNEGALWYSQNSTTTEKINSMYFTDSLNGTAVGNNGLIITTHTSGEIPTYKIITGSVRYEDNDGIVTSGWVRAIKYDTATGKIITIDSSAITPNGEYLVKVPLGDSTDIMAYQDDETADYVPTYHPSSIDWTESMTIYPSENRSNVNIKVFRMDTTSTPQGYASGKVFKTVLRPDNSHLPESIVYAKVGNVFKGFSISDADGEYHIDLPLGSYTLFVKRYGYTNDSTGVTVQSPILTHDSLNFYLQKLSSGINPQEGAETIFFHLDQNYPNPFNPSTTIRYVLGSTSFVKLTIYDITGKEIAILENSEKFPGSYKVDFKAESLPSGIYFYKLETDKYVSSKSMILLK